MYRSPFIITQCAQDLSQNDVGPQCSLGSIIGRLYTRIDDKGEPVVKLVVDFPYEFPDVLDRILFPDPLPKRFSRQVA